MHDHPTATLVEEPTADLIWARRPRNFTARKTTPRRVIRVHIPASAGWSMPRAGELTGYVDPISGHLQVAVDDSSGGGYTFCSADRLLVLAGAA